MRRHQILREELRQRRKQLECLMAEHQRRSGNSDSTHRTDDQEDITTNSLPVSRDERYGLAFETKILAFRNMNCIAVICLRF